MSELAEVCEHCHRPFPKGYERCPPGRCIRASAAARAAAPVEDPCPCVTCKTAVDDCNGDDDNCCSGCRHMPTRAAPVEAGLADVLIVPMGDCQDAIQVVHEPCGAQLLATMTVHLDTLVGIADRHTCRTPVDQNAAESSGSDLEAEVGRDE